MSHISKISTEPTTPAKSSEIGIMDAGEPQTNQETNTGLTKDGDPSPASTYGDTAGGDSVPATPLENVQTENSVKHQVCTTTPVRSNEKVRPALLQHDVGNSSPARLAGMVADLSISCITDDTIHAVSSSASDSGLAEGSKALNSSFIVHDSNSTMDDPFTSPAFHHADRSTTLSPDSIVTTRALSASNKTNGNKMDNAVVDSTSLSSPFSPREDRIGQQPSADNAQALYPPDACVFVANLSSARTDEELAASVSHAFGVFGLVWVKIRRDNRHMPYAFCQYENKQNADRAIIEGKNALIDGRKCRTEIAKVQRALYISRHNGESVHEDEVRQLLSVFGAIEKVWLPSETDREMYQLPQGIWVRFAYFQDCRDAHAALRDDSVFRLEQKQERTKTRSQQFMSSGHMHSAPGLHNYKQMGYGSPSSRRNSPAVAGARTSEEGSSLFLGNLPPDITQQELIHIFGKYGSVLSAQVISKASPASSKQNVFAFVDFPNHDTVQNAVDCETGNLNIRGYNVRVEWKVLFDNTRRGGFHGNRSRQGTFSGSPRGRLQLTPTVIQPSLPSFQPPYNMTVAPFGYNHLPQSSTYVSPSSLTGYSSSQGSNTGLLGNRGETSQSATSHFPNMELQPGFLPHFQHHEIGHGAPRVASVHVPFSFDQGQRGLEGGDRLSWQLAYDRYAQEHSQTYSTQYIGPMTSPSNTFTPTYSTDHSHQLHVEGFDETAQETSPSLADPSLSC